MVLPAANFIMGRVETGLGKAVYGHQEVGRWLKRYNVFNMGAIVSRFWEVARDRKALGTEAFYGVLRPHVPALAGALGLDRESLKYIIRDTLIQQAGHIRDFVPQYIRGLYADDTRVQNAVRLYDTGHGIVRFGRGVAAIVRGEEPELVGARGPTLNALETAFLEMMGIDVNGLAAMDDLTESLCYIIADELSGPLAHKMQDQLTKALAGLIINEAGRGLLSFLISKYGFAVVASTFPVLAPACAYLRVVHIASSVFESFAPSIIHGAARLTGRTDLLPGRAQADIRMGERVAATEVDAGNFASLAGIISSGVLEQWQEHAALAGRLDGFGHDVMTRVRMIAPPVVRRCVPEEAPESLKDFPWAFVKSGITSALFYTLSGFAIQQGDDSFTKYCKWVRKVDPQLANMMERSRVEERTVPISEAQVAEVVPSEGEESEEEVALLQHVPMPSSGALGFLESVQAMAATGCDMLEEGLDRVSSAVDAVGERLDDVAGFSAEFEALQAMVDQIHGAHPECPRHEAYLRAMIQKGLREAGLVDGLIDYGEVMEAPGAAERAVRRRGRELHIEGAQQRAVQRQERAAERAARREKTE
jgi:hypothetical protein